MRKEIKEGTKINPVLIKEYGNLQEQQQMIDSLHSYLIFSLVVVVIGLLCVWWGFGGLNTRFLARFSPHTRIVVAWVAVSVTLLNLLFAAYLFGVTNNAKKHLEKDIKEYNEKFPQAKYIKQKRN